MSVLGRCALVFVLTVLIQTSAIPRAAGQDMEIVGKFPRNQGLLGFTVPNWHNGYFSTFDGGFSVVKVVDTAGNFVTQARVTSTLTPVRFIYATDVSNTGRIAFSYSTPQAESGIAWMSPTGEVEVATITDDFSATRLSFDPNGTLWVLGRSARTDFLAHFDASGKQLPTLVEFPRDGNPGNFDPWVNGLTATGRTLVNNGERIGLLAVCRHIWLEVAPDGTVLGQWSLPPAREVSGTAMTANGEVYISARFPSLRRVDNPDAYDPDDRLFKLDRESGEWNEIEVTNLFSSEDEGGYFRLQGADGDDLVFSAQGFPYEYLVTRVVP